MRPLIERSKQIDRLKKEYETNISQKSNECTNSQNELEKLAEQTDLLHVKLREAKADLDVSILSFLLYLFSNKFFILLNLIIGNKIVS